MSHHPLSCAHREAGRSASGARRVPRSAVQGGLLGPRRQGPLPSVSEASESRGNGAERSLDGGREAARRAPAVRERSDRTHGPAGAKRPPSLPSAARSAASSAEPTLCGPGRPPLHPQHAPLSRSVSANHRHGSHRPDHSEQDQAVSISHRRDSRALQHFAVAVTLSRLLPGPNRVGGSTPSNGGPPVTSRAAGNTSSTCPRRLSARGFPG
jgi:hypothetical protein